MANKKYLLWEDPPYIGDTKDGFMPSVTEYRVNDKKSTVIVCPGGGYSHKAYHEGEPVAEMFCEHGINAFVLDYDVAPCNKYAPLADAQRAIRLARSLGYEKVAILGFSAGGHLTCTAGTMYDLDAYKRTDAIDEYSARPDAFLPCYPVVSMCEPFSNMGSRKNLLGEEWENDELAISFSCERNITESTPPCFIWHTANDACVPVKNSFALASALSENGVYFEMHIYPNGSHGLGLAKDKDDISTWSEHACTFLSKLGF